MKLLANAKLNLNLAIVGNCGPFHQLQSNVTTVDICDHIAIQPRDDRLVNVTGMDIATECNIAYRAGVMMVEQCGTMGVDIAITKGIPLSSGMGGSSADGAGVLVGMCCMFGIATDDSRVLDIASAIGSDVSYLMQGGCAIISGKGDDVENLPYVQRYFVVTTFDVRLDTGMVYALYDSSAKLSCDNALQGAVEQHYDYMTSYQQLTGRLGYTGRMTGSGSAYYVQCNSWAEATELATQLNAQGYSSTPCTSSRQGVQILDK